MPSDYERIETAIRFIDGHAGDQPSLEEVAGELGLSPHHTQRLFRRWAGLSPKQFLKTLTVEHAKRRLADAATVLDAAYDVGLSGPGRLHDHFVTIEAVTPGEYKSDGAALLIRWGVHPCPFGSMFVAVTERGICRAAFIDDGEAGGELETLDARWPDATLAADPDGTRRIVDEAFAGDRVTPLLVHGTNFQVNVWKALLRIPSGAVCSYEQVARAMGRPSASRAVGTAVGANPVAWLIPCHRVIRAVGRPGAYRWGATRKRALLSWEAREGFGVRRTELGKTGARTE